LGDGNKKKGFKEETVINPGNEGMKRISDGVGYGAR
jgi:hypothetical protein